jgi:hypothetical protein
MIYTVDEIKTLAIPIAEQYGVNRMCLFGSYARGDATSDSDVDFLIERGDIHDLLEYVGFIEDLENAFGCHVDVVSTGIEDKSFLALIMRDVVSIYEKP